MSRIEKIGDATLYLGDCMEILPTLPKVDAVITDPPYGVGAATSSFQNATKRGSAAAASRNYGDSEWDAAPPGADLLRLVVAGGRHAILWGGNYFTVSPSTCWLVWDKENGSNGYADCELAWTNLPKAVRRLKWRWAGMLQQDMGNKEERVHPTQKPVAVMEWCIEQAGDPATVLDPFMGSGTTGVAAVNRGCAFIGIEREPRYFDIACERIAKAYAQRPLFDAEPAPQPKQEALL